MSIRMMEEQLASNALKESFIRCAKKTIKEKPCDKTMSGKHMFRDKGVKNGPNTFELITQCLACGIINDLDTKE